VEPATPAPLVAIAAAPAEPKELSGLAAAPDDRGRRPSLPAGPPAVGDKPGPPQSAMVAVIPSRPLQEAGVAALLEANLGPPGRAIRRTQAASVAAAMLPTAATAAGAPPAATTVPSRIEAPASRPLRATAAPAVNAIAATAEPARGPDRPEAAIPTPVAQRPQPAGTVAGGPTESPAAATPPRSDRPVPGKVEMPQEMPVGPAAVASIVAGLEAPTEPQARAAATAARPIAIAAEPGARPQTPQPDPTVSLTMAIASPVRKQAASQVPARLGPVGTALERQWSGPERLAAGAVQSPQAELPPAATVAAAIVAGPYAPRPVERPERSASSPGVLPSRPSATAGQSALNPGLVSPEPPGTPLRAPQARQGVAVAVMPSPLAGSLPSLPPAAGLGRSKLGVEARVRLSPGELYREREPARRQETIRTHGGTLGTERSVEQGLEFLARYQFPDGHWSLHQMPDHARQFPDPALGQMQSDTAATGLAMLCFLGAGYTHQQGKYQAAVDRGLRWLVERQKPEGDLFTGGTSYAWFYSQGIATIALGEACGMTRDRQLRAAAQKAVAFIVDAQEPEHGGWRYLPRQESDTSVTGWQLLALRSAEMAGLEVPEATLQGIGRWLDSARGDGLGGRYVYNPLAADTPQQRSGRVTSLAMTAEGLLMRLYLGWAPNHPALINGADHLKSNLPEWGTGDHPRRDAYYWYYGTQFMFQMQGDWWTQWNARIRTLLTESQVREGPWAGSWHPLLPVPDRWGEPAGRLYVTTLHLLMMEVYYRHLLLFQPVPGPGG